MKHTLPKFSYTNYVRYLRKQGTHIQHIHAFAFAAIITGITAFLILYYDYGLFHDVYVSDEAQKEIDMLAEAPTPGETFTSFWGEVRERFSSIGEGGVQLLEGKDVYTNTSSTTP